VAGAPIQGRDTKGKEVKNGGKGKEGSGKEKWEGTKG